MKRWLTTLLRALGLFSFLAAAPLQAGDAPSGNPPEVLEKAGALLGEMKELGQEYLDSRHTRGMTPEKREAQAGRVARKLAGYRDGLAELGGKLDPASDFAAKLGKFLGRWPDEAAFRQELLGESGGDKVQAEVVSLWLQVPDKRAKWKTPFPFFRP